ncbi:MAG: 5-(carboxyamino)imidazole ribonucleotide mutase [Bacteroidales bacterium]|nr:5-(carboxyamino)imidazole ribonucleotide mutase [Bacteroidales bacterium]MDD2824343.1 5-(carboxyamino)imidazole ribonucleotide mutase [Bacteroidales bacterium]MDD3099891.1 5-(carboxyamino)imidazole ribonucleotide mutase [Bacteroidales bacterium]MDD3638603.1 5-(carboxyamino)imidazole ribonucleotide mutase [Bacteroidales bacterium]MDD3943270.1 5-(carboxyamino)imidazole ribonucleotide mutase [Bacteroidales bacterium]
MKPQVSIIMGSMSDMPVMEEAARFLDQMEIPFEMNALSAHRTPDKVAEYAKSASQRGVKVIIAGAGGAAHLPGVVAAYAQIPVIGVPVKSSQSLSGLDSILSILQMPSGIPVATMALDGARNAAIFAARILSLSDKDLALKMRAFHETLGRKVEEANEKIKDIQYRFKIQDH